MKKTMLWLGVLVFAMALSGCGKSEKELSENAIRRAVDEGLAAEVLGDWEGAQAKYALARRIGGGEGYRKQAELMMYRGETEMFMRNPKDASWLGEAKAWLGRMEAFGLEAAERGCPVEGLQTVLEEDGTRIADVEKALQNAKNADAFKTQTQKESNALAEKTADLQALHDRREMLGRDESLLERAFGEVYEQYERYAKEWMDALAEWLEDDAWMAAQYGTSSGKTQIDNRYRRLRESSEKQLEELQKKLATAESEIQECARQIAEGEAEFLRELTSRSPTSMEVRE